MLPVAVTDPAVTILPALTLLVALIKPVTYAPVLANTAAVLPATPIVVLPFATTVTLLVPLEILDVLPAAMPVSNAPLPIK